MSEVIRRIVFRLAKGDYVMVLVADPAQAAILAVGRTAVRFIPDEAGHPVLRPMMTVTLSVDHRVVDGAEAARFISTLQGILETAGAQWG